LRGVDYLLKLADEHFGIWNEHNLRFVLSEAGELMDKSYRERGYRHSVVHLFVGVHLCTAAQNSFGRECHRDSGVLVQKMNYVVDVR